MLLQDKKQQEKSLPTSSDQSRSDTFSTSQVARVNPKVIDDIRRSFSEGNQDKQAANIDGSKDLVQLLDVAGLRRDSLEGAGSEQIRLLKSPLPVHDDLQSEFRAFLKATIGPGASAITQYDVQEAAIVWTNIRNIKGISPLTGKEFDDLLATLPTSTLSYSQPQWMYKSRCINNSNDKVDLQAQSFWKELGTFLMTMVKELGISDIGQGLSKYMQGMAGAQKEAIQGLGQLFCDLWDVTQGKTTWKELWQNVEKRLEKLGKEFGKAFEGAVQGMKGVGKLLFELSPLSDFYDFFKNTMEAVKHFQAGNQKEAWKYVAFAAGNLAMGIIGVVSLFTTAGAGNVALGTLRTSIKKLIPKLLESFLGKAAAEKFLKEGGEKLIEGALKQAARKAPQIFKHGEKIIQTAMAIGGSLVDGKLTWSDIFGFSLNIAPSLKGAHHKNKTPNLAFVSHNIEKYMTNPDGKQVFTLPTHPAQTSIGGKDITFIKIARSRTDHGPEVRFVTSKDLAHVLKSKKVEQKADQVGFYDVKENVVYAVLPEGCGPNGISKVQIKRSEYIKTLAVVYHERFHAKGHGEFESYLQAYRQLQKEGYITRTPPAEAILDHIRTHYGEAEFVRGLKELKQLLPKTAERLAENIADGKLNGRKITDAEAEKYLDILMEESSGPRRSHVTRHDKMRRFNRRDEALTNGIDQEAPEVQASRVSTIASHGTFQSELRTQIGGLLRMKLDNSPFLDKTYSECVKKSGTNGPYYQFKELYTDMLTHERYEVRWHTRTTPANGFRELPGFRVTKRDARGSHFEYVDNASSGMFTDPAMKSTLARAGIEVVRDARGCVWLKHSGIDMMRGSRASYLLPSAMDRAIVTLSNGKRMTGAEINKMIIDAMHINYIPKGMDISKRGR